MPVDPVWRAGSERAADGKEPKPQIERKATGKKHGEILGECN